MLQMSSITSNLSTTIADIPLARAECESFSRDSSAVTRMRSANATALSKHAQLIDILEIPFVSFNKLDPQENHPDYGNMRSRRPLGRGAAVERVRDEVASAHGARARHRAHRRQRRTDARAHEAAADRPAAHADHAGAVSEVRAAAARAAGAHRCAAEIHFLAGSSQ